MREAGIDVMVGAADAGQLPGYDLLIDDESVIEVGDVRLRAMHTPGHTPGSVSFKVEGAPLLFTGDTLFPGGPGATHFEGGDFPTIISSIEQRFFAPLDADVTIWPGHGAAVDDRRRAPAPRRVGRARLVGRENGARR